VANISSIFGASGADGGSRNSILKFKKVLV
jgi:hypothetical protein